MMMMTMMMMIEIMTGIMTGNDDKHSMIKQKKSKLEMILRLGFLVK